MEALRQQLVAAEAERDRAEAERATAAARATQAVADLAIAQAAATGQGGGGAPTVVTFAMSPALASNSLIDYSSGEGMKLYGKATAPLDVLFGGE